MNLKKLKHEKGISLVTTIVVVSLLTTISVALLSMVVSDNKIAANHIETTKAFWIAESGLEKGLYWLRYQDPPPDGTAAFTQYNNVSFGSGTFTVVIDPDDGNTTTHIKQYLIRSTGTIANYSRQLEVQVKMNTFNKYIYATGDEGSGTIWFTTGDQLSGPMHSNDQIAIKGSPVFMGRVSSSASSFLEGSGYNPTFAEGYQLNAPTVTFPSAADVLANYTDVHGGPPDLIIDATGNKHAEMQFNSNGTIDYDVYRWTGPPWHRTKVYDVPLTNISLGSINGFIQVNGDVEVEGTVSGQVTLYATDDIEIVDDIVYLNSGVNGEPNVNCPDHLGLISLQDVVVSYTTPNLNDVIICGAVLALGNSFTVENYWSGSARGYIHLWGSLSQKIRGPVGTMGWHGMTGYYKDYNYDERYQLESPPYFPTTGNYEISSWREVVN
jgi:Tfp pilus assembly protein PilX